MNIDMKWKKEGWKIPQAGGGCRKFDNRHEYKEPQLASL